MNKAREAYLLLSRHRSRAAAWHCSLRAPPMERVAMAALFEMTA